MKLWRLSGSVVSGLVFYSECNTKDARMGVGAFFTKCKSLEDQVALDHASIKVLEISRVIIKQIQRVLLAAQTER